MAEVLWICIDVVRHTAFTGEPSAQILGHDIISLRRDDVLSWLEAGNGWQRADRAHTGL